MGLFNEEIFQHLKRTNPFIRKVDVLVDQALEGR
jgi:hypothetical protein